MTTQRDTLLCERANCLRVGGRPSTIAQIAHIETRYRLPGWTLSGRKDLGVASVSGGYPKLLYMTLSRREMKFEVRNYN
jgi:hypothetical protein